MKGGIWLIWTSLLLSTCANPPLPALNLTASAFTSFLQSYLFCGEVAFSLQEQTLTLLIDTDMTVSAIQLPIVTSADCRHCPGGVYAQRESRSYTNLSEYEEISISPIGYCSGWLSTEYLTLPGQSPIPIHFVLVTSEDFSQYQRIEGVLVRQM